MLIMESFETALSFCLKTKFALFLINTKRNEDFYGCLRPKQIDCVKSVLDGDTRVVVLPTGYGKSLIYELVQKKKQVADTMRDPDGTVRMLFATEAYGMGAHAPDVRQIVHIGLPNSLETYVQEVGRAGRDGRQSTAILFYNASDLGANRKNLKSEMREFCTIDTCRRQFICKHFRYDKPSVTSDTIHNCCDNCEKSGDCHECFVNMLTGMDVDGSAENNSSEKTKPSKEMKRYLTNALATYFDMENLANNGAINTGLSKGVLNQIVKDPFKFRDEHDLRTTFSHIKATDINNMFHIIANIRSVVDAKRQ